MTCLVLGLCLVVWVAEEPAPPPVPVLHVVKTVTVTVQPQPFYPCGEP